MLVVWVIRSIKSIDRSINWINISRRIDRIRSIDHIKSPKSIDQINQIHLWISSNHLINHISWNESTNRPDQSIKTSIISIQSFRSHIRSNRSIDHIYRSDQNFDRINRINRINSSIRSFNWILQLKQRYTDILTKFAKLYDLNDDVTTQSLKVQLEREYETLSSDCPLSDAIFGLKSLIKNLDIFLNSNFRFIFILKIN